MYLLFHDTMYFKIEILTSRKLTTSLSFEQLGPGILQEARVTQMVISDENMKINLNKIVEIFPENMYSIYFIKTENSQIPIPVICSSYHSNRANTNAHLVRTQVHT